MPFLLVGGSKATSDTISYGYNYLRAVLTLQGEDGERSVDPDLLALSHRVFSLVAESVVFSQVHYTMLIIPLAVHRSRLGVHDIDRVVLSES